MAVQQNKVTRSRRNNRRSHDAIRIVNSAACPECGELKLPHHVCMACGSYSGREVFSPADDEELVDDEI